MFKNSIKSKSALSKFRKQNKNVYILESTLKTIHANSFYFIEYCTRTIKFSGKIDNVLDVAVKGLGTVMLRPFLK